MKLKKYAKPAVESEEVFEQTSLACTITELPPYNIDVCEGWEDVIKPFNWTSRVCQTVVAHTAAECDFDVAGQILS